MSAQSAGPWKVIAKKFWSASIGIMAAKKLATPVAWASRLCNGGDAEAIANANLIAAAPDLLAALRGYYENCACSRLDETCAFCGPARVAIAKAEGRS